MDLLAPVIPDIIRHLSNALIVRAAARECSHVTCAPTLSCASPLLQPGPEDASGYSGFTLSVTLVVGVAVGLGAYHIGRTLSQRSPSAATIALRKLG